MFKRILSALFLTVFLAGCAIAQELEVDRYNINARVDPYVSAADVRASLTLSNLSRTPKSRLYLRLLKLAKVSSVTMNGSAAQFEVTDDRRVPTLSQIIITPSSPIAAGSNATVEVVYRLEVPESTPLVCIYPGEVLLGPDAVWVPMPSTVFTMYGATTAPCSLTITLAPRATTLRAVSSGALKNDAQTVTFEQSLNTLPLIVASSFDQPLATEHAGVKVEVYVQSGINAVTATGKPPASSVASQLSTEAGKIIDFLTRTLGPPPGSTFRIISSSRAGAILAPGALVLNEQVFRREAPTASVIESLADAIARIWIDGRVRFRGQEPRSAQEDRTAVKARSAALLRESLPRYLALLYFEERFGRDGARAMADRMRWAYTPVAQSGRDSELGIQSVVLPNYTAAVLSKGPLVFRLIAETMGRDKFIAALKPLLSSGQTKVVNNDDLRAALSKAGGAEIDKLFLQWIDSITEPDIIVGAPLPGEKPGVQEVNLRNLGTGDVTVSLLAVTDSGKQVTSVVTVPSENITSVEVATPEKIRTVEVDPEKLIVQTSYDNDARDIASNALRSSAQTLFNDSIAAYNKGDYIGAETKLRQAVTSDPRTPLLRAWLARTLVALKKLDEASAEANSAIKSDPPVGSALAWAHIALGQIALARSQTPDAVRHLRLAVSHAEETPAHFAARESLVQAERAANMTAPVEEPIRAFITSFDTAIKTASSDRLQTMVVSANLKKFIQGLTVSRPAAWTTEILRAEQYDANRYAIDVALRVRSEGRDQSGTAVFVLCRADGNWLLEDVQLFNVK